MPRKTKDERIKEYVVLLEVEQENYDTEVAHSNADDLLVKLLREIGYAEVTDAFEGVHRWYA